MNKPIIPQESFELYYSVFLLKTSYADIVKQVLSFKKDIINDAKQICPNLKINIANKDIKICYAKNYGMKLEYYNVILNPNYYNEIKKYVKDLEIYIESLKEKKTELTNFEKLVNYAKTNPNDLARRLEH